MHVECAASPPLMVSDTVVSDTVVSDTNYATR